MKNAISKALAPGALALAAVAASGCTQQTANSFRLRQSLERFDAADEINTRIDMLWVVDNSASMDVSQEKLRRGFESFAEKYLKSTWDIRLAVITTDTYMANPAFSGYLSSTMTGSVGWASPYVNSRLDTWVNPEWNPDLVHLPTGTFKNGIRRADQVPAWGPNYAKLLPGVHDGPIAALCTEAHSYFFSGVSDCRVRDDQGAPTGTEGCLRPGGGQTSITQCVNTVQNDTVHSGEPIVSTQPQDEETAADAAWQKGINDAFMVNASVGSAGSGSERGFSSLSQFLDDNEWGETAFFRPNSQRVILFVTDEDDQSMQLPSSPASGFTPFTSYLSSCPSKTVDGHTYRLSLCPDPVKLVAVDGVKQELDEFFATIDGPETAPGTYMIVSIVPTTGEAIANLQAQRRHEDAAVGNDGDVAVDRGDRYLELGALVGNGSLSLNIAADDYSPLLDSIGRAVIEKRSSFTLKRLPTGTEDMVVSIIHDDGTEDEVSPDQYVIEGKTLTFTDLDFVLGLSSSDRILINYQPMTVY